MAWTWKIDGLKELDKKLASLEKRIRSKVIRQAQREAMKIVKRAVEADAPEGETGELKASVKTRSGPRSRMGISTVVQIGAESFRGETYYAAFVEFGTEFQHAQHYMKLAYFDHALEARNAAVKFMAAGIKRELQAR